MILTVSSSAKMNTRFSFRAVHSECTKVLLLGFNSSELSVLLTDRPSLRCLHFVCAHSFFRHKVVLSRLEKHNDQLYTFTLFVYHLSVASNKSLSFALWHYHTAEYQIS